MLVVCYSPGAGKGELAQWKIYYYLIEIRYFRGDNNILLTFTINKKYELMHVYVSKMAASIAFVCQNAVEAI
jgi:hypothetical protein